MDKFELNKILGAVLGTLTFVMGLNVVSSIIFTSEKPVVPGYDLPVPKVEAAASTETAAETEALPVLLAAADPGRGQSAARKCMA